MAKWILFLILYIFSLRISSQENWIIHGHVRDTSGNSVAMAGIKLQNDKISATTDINGFFSLKLKNKSEILIEITAVGFENKTVEINYVNENQSIEIELDIKEEQLKEVKITDSKSKEKGLLQIDPILLNNIPNISGNQVQTFIKTLPGVASTSELSSTYSVRGGSFDENLVYVNGIEVFRPMLLQSGQQEGLDMVNSDLVSKVEFSAGGFSSLYDDKMSSVLDIKYKKPTEFKASASLSLLGASAHVEGINRSKKFSWLAGFRYKNSKYLFNSLETEGEYKPNFLDLQSVFGYKLSEKSNLSAIFYLARNNYLFYPENRTTSFGTANEALSLYVDYSGNEKDSYKSILGGITYEFKPGNNLNLKFTGSAYTTREAITYNFEGWYSLNELDKNLGSSTFGDSIMNLGIGHFIDHARSYLDAFIVNLNHNGWLMAGNHFIQWGLKAQNENYSDKVNEWQMLDSAGYSVPSNTEFLALSEWMNSSNELIATRFSAYLQDNFKTMNSLFNIEYGTRLSWWEVSRQFLLSPRISMGYYVGTLKRIYLRIGGGIYRQSVFYREMIDQEGNMNKDIKLPYSIQYTASVDYDFKMMGRPFHLKSEIYFKNLKKLTPYSVDNIRINYYPFKTGKGYAGGIDFRLNGEFVPGTDSWLSMAFMKSGIKIEGDTIGYQPLPNDHLFNLSLFFQDYVPGNKQFRMYMALYYLSGMPFGPPNKDSYYAPLRMPAYKRVDIGFSMALKREDKVYSQKYLNYFRDILFNIEVFNLLGINNTISYNWVTVVPNTSVAGNDNYASFAVPNRLSARRLNLRLTIRF